MTKGKSPQPNIVFIMADQLAAKFVGAYGSGVDSTPQLDLLAARGMRFDRSYCSATVCGPARASILTGRRPSFHGVVINNLTVPEDMPTYPKVLKSKGYRIGGFGKFHHTPMHMPLPKDLSQYGFDESVPSEDPKDGPYMEWIASQHPEWMDTALAMYWPRLYDAPEFAGRQKKARERILDPRKNASRWNQMYSSPLPKEMHQTSFITDRALDFMRDHAAQHAEQPFFCLISYVDPHDPYDPPAPYDKMFNPADMPEAIPASWSEEKDPALAYSQNFSGFRTIASDANAIAELRALYHGSLKFMDDQIGRVISYLDQVGLSENTIIVFTSDHGEMLGDHALITKGVKFYDAGIRIPLIISGPGIDAGVSLALTCSLDLFPSFCGWAGIDKKPPLEGKSLEPLCRGRDQSIPWEEVTVEGPYRQKYDVYAPSSRGIITNDQWRLTVYDDQSRGEMFNLNDDPDENRNLYDDPKFLSEKCKLMERMVKAYMRGCAVQQYRNLPVRNGSRCYIENTNKGFDDSVFQG
jgi:choline-sulfatase